MVASSAREAVEQFLDRCRLTLQCITTQRCWAVALRSPKSYTLLSSRTDIGNHATCYHCVGVMEFPRSSSSLLWPIGFLRPQVRKGSQLQSAAICSRSTTRSSVNCSHTTGIRQVEAVLSILTFTYLHCPLSSAPCHIRAMQLCPFRSAERICQQDSSLLKTLSRC